MIISTVDLQDCTKYMSEGLTSWLLSILFGVDHKRPIIFDWNLKQKRRNEALIQINCIISWLYFLSFGDTPCSPVPLR